MKITKIASDLNENSENRYELVCKIADQAKKIVDEQSQRKNVDEVFYGSDQMPKRVVKAVIQSMMMVASASDGDELIG